MKRKERILPIIILVSCLFLALCQPTITALATAEKATIVAGYSRSFAIKADNSLWAWGSNQDGQLGDGTTTDRYTPVKIMDSVITVFSESAYTAALKTDGSLWTWGVNWCGLLGDGTRTDRHSPVKIMDSVAYVSTGEIYAMAVKTDGSLWSWGRNFYGVLGDGTTIDHYAPVKIMDSVDTVLAGNGRSFAIKTDGSLWGWGTIYFDVFGDGKPPYSPDSPVKIMESVASIVTSSDGIVVLKKDGSLWDCRAKYNNLTKADPDPPMIIMESVILTFPNEGLVLKADHSLRHTSDSTIFMDSVASVALNGISSMAIKTDGSLWAWGSNGDGELGDGTKTYRYAPVKIMDSVATVSLGRKNESTGADDQSVLFAMAVKTDGSLWAWGANSYGQIGDGSTEQRLLPVKIMDGVKISSAGAAISTDTDPIDSASLWARDAIAAALRKGFVPVSIQDKYTSVITRQEFCCMAVMWVEYALGKNLDSILAERGLYRDPSTFIDTSDPDILAAFALGITSGTGNGYFTPKGQFSREQAATMILNTCRAVGANVSNSPASGFADVGSASSWAVRGIDYVRANGIMQGTGGNNFNPKATYTREQSIITFNNISLDILTGS